MITLKTLEQATPQEVFEQITINLLKQNKKSMRKGYCRYRGTGKTKCAGGWLISDEEYNPVWDDEPWEVLISENIVPFAHEDLIIDLQNIHDNEDEESWLSCFIDLASDNELDSKCLEPYR